MLFQKKVQRQIRGPSMRPLPEGKLTASGRSVNKSLQETATRS